ncbi:MAG: hypothetical protein ABI472_16500 [Ginsengibacter sp.]
MEELKSTLSLSVPVYNQLKLNYQLGVAYNPGEAGFDNFIFNDGACGPYYKSNGYMENAFIRNTEIGNKSSEGYGIDIFTSKAIDWIISRKF